MSINTSEEAMGRTSSNNSNSNDRAHIAVKGKRTKRQRHLLQSPAAGVTTASSTSSAEFSGSTTEEEEDMANCLILLAQGQALDAGCRKLEGEVGGGGGSERFTSRKFAEAAAITNGKAGRFYVYECKTCNKRFPSFQALGGHRASHKRPKMGHVAALEDNKKALLEEDGLQITVMNHPQSNNNNKSRVHECSICGSEFSSGQALGGHMRRHRSVILPENQEVKKERNILSLDLNLPAPSEDERGDNFPKSPASSSFAFASKQPLLFSASALVDCHY